jgi:thioester reductase-like protein
MIFLTGTTGFLGRELLSRLQYTEDKIAVLVRSNGVFSAEQRLKQICASLPGSPLLSESFQDRIIPVEGDIGLPNFGMGDSEFDSLAKQISTIYHVAASTSLDQPHAEAFKVNVGGTQHVAELGMRSSKLNGVKPEFFHVSTAYVAGNRDGEIVSPDTTLRNSNFRNSYEKSKAEAEKLLYGMSDHLDLCVFRPSVIVGNSTDGSTTSFNVVYLPAKLLAYGLFHVFPAIPHTPFDIVPVDYVSDAIIALAQKKDRSKKIYHLCAGVGRESSPAEILNMIIKTCNKYKWRGKSIIHPPKFISPELVLELVTLTFCSFSVARNSLKSFEKIVNGPMRLLRQVLPFVPYATNNPRFEISETTKELEGILIPPPLFCSYAEKIFKYCLDTDWGKNVKTAY